MRSLILGLVGLVTIMGCNELTRKAVANVTTPSSNVTYAQVRVAVFEPFGCITCHGTVAGYSVETRERAILSSKLCEYLEKGYMPPRGEKPSAELAKMACDWVSAGAP